MARIGLGLLGEPDIPGMMEAARQAEAAGYESIWVTETRFTRDAITTATAVALATRRVRVATGVINVYTRGAALCALTFAALDEAAGGRAVAGIGPGSPLILERQGIAFEHPLGRLREYVEAMRAIWRGEPVTREGRYVRLRDLRIDFRPPRPALPVYLGVTGPQALTLAGEIADGVLLNGFTSVPYARRAIAAIAEGAERAGRRLADLEICHCLITSCAPDGRAARDAIRPLVALYLTTFPNIARESGLPEERLAAVRAAVGAGGPARGAAEIGDEVLDLLVVAGTPDECRARVAAYRAAGVALPVLFVAAGDPAYTVRELADA